MQEEKEKKVVEKEEVQENHPENQLDKKNDKKKDHKKEKKSENSKIVKLETENKELQDKVLRISAEMQNMRRRMEEEKMHLLKYEGEELIKQLLPVIDNFERAINMNDDKLNDEVKKYLSGFKMIYGNINSILNNYDIKPIDVLEKTFDANTMEAVMVEECKDFEPNTVIEVLQKGYTYKGKVIRHAMVKVNK